MNSSVLVHQIVELLFVTFLGYSIIDDQQFCPCPSDCGVAYVCGGGSVKAAVVGSCCLVKDPLPPGSAVVQPPVGG